MKRLIRVEVTDGEALLFENDGRLEVGFGPEVLVINEKLSSAENAARVTRFVLPMRRFHQLLMIDDKA